MNFKTFRMAGAALLLAGLLLAPAAALAAPVADSGREIKEAAQARVLSVYPGFAIDHIELDRWVPNYATAVVYPNLAVNVTDPGTVILRNESNTWVAIGGPGTAFPPGEREGAPDELFDYDNPYTGVNAENAINRLNVARVPFDNGRVSFQYPGDATVAQDGEIQVLGPEVNEPLPSGGTFQGRAYEISVAPLNETTNGPLDEWGYDRMLREWQQRIDAAGPGARVAPPMSATFFHLDNADVFQIDWLAGDAVQRDFYLTRSGGGKVVKVSTLAYPIENNPAAPRAESAVNLVLHTLQQAGDGSTPGMPRTGAGFEEPIIPILLVAGFTALLVGLIMRQLRKSEEKRNL